MRGTYLRPELITSTHSHPLHTSCLQTYHMFSDVAQKSLQPPQLGAAILYGPMRSQDEAAHPVSPKAKPGCGERPLAGADPLRASK